jgi:predicted lipase
MRRLAELPPQFYTDHGSTAFQAFAARTEFDLGNARAMMWLSQLAYETEQPDTIDHARALWGFDSIERMIKTKSSVINGAPVDSRGIIAKRADATIIAIAGTEPAAWQNLATDLAVFQSRSNTHSGFQDATDAIQPQIENAIRTSTKPVLFTGHSLGGAMAVIAALRARTESFSPLALYLFGAPRAGGATFAARYNPVLGERTYRLVHGFDIVSRVPTSSMGYHHVGRLLECGSGKKFDRNAPLAPVGGDNPQLLPGLLASVQDSWARIAAGRLLTALGPGPLGKLLRVVPPPLRDHLPDRYIAALG